MNESLKDKENTQKVALYIRVSTDDQVEKFGIPLQMQSLKALIESKGKLLDGRPAWQLAGEKYIYTDEGISGAMDIDERPEFARLKEDILMSPKDSKPFDIVAVYKIDRFARKLKILLDVIDCFDQNQINFVSANESIDTSTPFGRAMLSIIGVIAELERENILERTSSGRTQAALSGVAMSNVATYGYKKDPAKRPIILEEESEVVRKIFYLFLEGQSPEQIARTLTGLGVLTPEASALKYMKRKGKIKNKNPITYWRSERIRLLLKDEIYIGKQYFNKTKNGKPLPKSEWKITEYEVPSIIDVLTFNKVQKRLGKMKHERKISPSKHTYLLSGLLKCDCCYNPAVDHLGRATWCGDRKKLDSGEYSYYYICGRKKLSKSSFQCPAISLPATEIENFIIDQCFETIKSPTAVFKHQQNLRSTKKQVKFDQQKKESLIKLIQTTGLRKKNLKEQHKESIIDIKTLKAGLENEDQRIAELKAELKSIDEEIAKGNSIEQYISTLELFSKKYQGAIEDLKKNRESLYTLLHLLIEEIVVLTRPVKPEDRVAGQKKANQQIPEAIHIKLKLPQDIFYELTRTETEGSGQETIGGAR